jgi:hypothetical protein
MEDYTYVGRIAATLTSQERGGFNTSNFASIKFNIGQLCVYPGYYLDSTNLLDDIIYLQDSYYYQIYSYVTIIDESLKTYRDILRGIVHPAGTKHFADHIILNTMQLNLEVGAEVNLIQLETSLSTVASLLDAVIKTFNKTVRTTTILSDLQLRFDVTKRLPTNNVNLSEADKKDVTIVKRNSATLSDISFRDVHKVLRTTSITSDLQLSKNISAVRRTTTNVLDNSNRSVGKQASSTTVASDVPPKKDVTIVKRNSTILSDTSNRSVGRILRNTSTTSDLQVTKSITAVRRTTTTANDNASFYVDKIATPISITVVDAQPEKTVTIVKRNSTTISDTSNQSSGKTLRTTATTSTSVSSIGSYKRSFTDTSLASDNQKILNPTKKLDTLLNGITDVISTLLLQIREFTSTTHAADLISKTQAKSFQSASAISDIATTNSAKYSTDAVTLIQQGGAYMEPLYVIQYPVSYWEAEYLENERKFTT